MTAEVAFAKSFLSTLDSRAVKLQSDHAADQRSIQPKGAYTLPKMPNAMKAPQRLSTPGADPSTDVHIKSSRGPPVDIRLSALPLNTSILELKQKVAMEAGLDGTDKIRLLYSKKPCSDSKSIKDVLGGESLTAAEFTVMFIGVTPGTSTQADTSTAAKATQPSEESGQAVLETEEFWTDLEGYLRQQLKGTAVAQSTAKLFRDAWKEKR